MTRALRLCAGLMALVGIGWGGSAHAAGGGGHDLPHLHWSFNGIFGTFDQKQLRDGLQVYTAVCAGCHGLEYVAFRNLADLGLTEDEIKAFAAEYEIEDGPDDFGEMFTRAGVPSDYFPDPYPNDKAAASVNNGAVPPDLSLMYKARHDGANYIYALLVGYQDEPPTDFQVMEGLSYNPYFPGNQIAMPQPLYGDDIEYADGTPATIEQQAQDVAAFLAWAAEPNLNARKQMGLSVILFLVVLTALLYASKRKIWRDIH